MNLPSNSRDLAVPRRAQLTGVSGGWVLAVLAAVAYANSLQGPFVFDDIGSIVENPTIRQLWPIGRPLSPPADWGFTVSGRPVLNLSFALNYALSGLKVWSYHALNLIIHLLAGLTLFGLVRRTLTRPEFEGRFSVEAPILALVMAAVWMLHPLQTESVTYTVQRAESLMGLFFLLTLYGFVRSTESSHPRQWRAVSLGACLLAVGTKEVAALAPLIVALYDRTFVSGTLREAWRRNRAMYLGLCATWLPLAWLVASTGGDRGGTMGFGTGMSSWSFYWLTQPEAIMRYLRLAFWPHPLVFEYGKVVPAGAAIILAWAVPMIFLIGVTVVALRKWPVVGFLGVWFLALLAPTSLVPGNQMIVEHRLYLPLIAVVVFVVGLLAATLPRRTFLLAGLSVVTAATILTVHRNNIYQNDQVLWEDTVAKRPNNARAQNNLGLVYYQRGRIDDAIGRYRESVRLDAGSAQAHYNLGLALMSAGQLSDAVEAFRTAVRIIPYYFNAHLNWAVVLMKLGRAEEALTHFADAVRTDPAPAEAHLRFGAALAELGRWSEAIGHYEAASRLKPESAEAHNNWGVALYQLAQIPAAIEHFNLALRLKPELPDAHFNLGLALAALGRQDESTAHYAEAIHLNPEHGDAQLNFGIALARQGRLPEAVVYLERAVALRPDSFGAQTNLATALAEIPSRVPEALAHYEAALRIRPNDPQAHYNLGFTLLSLGRTAEARTHFERALEIRPEFTAAGEILRQMAIRGF
ncbi:MAG: tetratricopeptide repeat protein [Opitutaceae bacterium]